jgi:hypothetical protein
MPRWLLCCLFFAALGFCRADCYGQAPDSTTRKSSLWERRRKAMEERRQAIAEQIRQGQERRAAWEKQPLLNADKPGKWSLSFNPLGLLEPQMAIGLGVGYQVTNCWQIWLESSGLCQFYQKPSQSCIGGVREILTMKFYFGSRQSFFAAAEFRWKQVYYHDVDNFENPTTSEELKSYTYKLEDIIFGGAVWFGGRVRISQNHRWRLEPSIGLGLKGRTVVWHGVPEGYQYQRSGGLDYIDPFPTSPRTASPVTFYFPASLRLVYVL